MFFALFRFFLFRSHSGSVLSCCVLKKVIRGGDTHTHTTTFNPNGTLDLNMEVYHFIELAGGTHRNLQAFCDGYETASR
jgi:hypothetical protein